MDLDLDPCTGAPANLISGAAALTDQPLEAESTGFFQKLFNVFVKLIEYRRQPAAL
jgi:hypothetical protein